MFHVKQRKRLVDDTIDIELTIAGNQNYPVRTCITPLKTNISLHHDVEKTL